MLPGLPYGCEDPIAQMFQENFNSKYTTAPAHIRAPILAIPYFPIFVWKRVSTHLSIYIKGCLFKNKTKQKPHYLIVTPCLTTRGLPVFRDSLRVISADSGN